jgi:formamidopyrimidine-DNA glycosylase
MPELAEVEFFRRRWKAGIGDKITEILLHPKARVLRGVPCPELARTLTGARLTEAERHGKQLFFRFEKGKEKPLLGLHMGMTGRLLVEPPDYAPAKADHLVLRQEARTLVFSDFRMFGRVRFKPGEAAPEWSVGLPPEILSAGFTLALCREGLRRHARTPVKAALLDQDLFPGIGNWMADEVLWQARIAPQRLCGSLSDPETAALHRLLRSVTKQSIATVSTVKGAHWGDPPDDWLFARRWKKGGHCPRCEAPLKHATLRGRTACWCPVCQA